MINTWFISDTHFGHKKILEYEKEHRPFDSIEEMNEAIIDRWNSVVRPKDIVYHLGDFALHSSYIPLAGKLAGKKYLVLGNHDTFHPSVYLPYFHKLLGGVFWKSCVLTHMPVSESGLGQRWFLNVHGHLHSKIMKKVQLGGFNPVTNEYYSTIEDKIIADPNYFNVSCEQNNLTPIHAEIILERVKELQS